MFPLRGRGEPNLGGVGTVGEPIALETSGAASAGTRYRADGIDRGDPRDAARERGRSHLASSPAG